MSLSKEEFQEYFANSCTYDDSDENCIPVANNILFYKIGMVKNNGDYVEDTWERANEDIDNFAEVTMIENLKRIKDEQNARFVSTLEIYMAYSPCSYSADQLIDFYQNQCPQPFELRIKFGTFYKIHEPTKACLIKMLNNGIDLDIFHGVADWVRFLNHVKIPKQDQEQYLEHVREKKRKDRETVDQGILDELYEGSLHCLSDDDFKSNFANSGTYGFPSHKRPPSTILFFNIRMENTDTHYVEDRWVKVENTRHGHAELEMIRILNAKMAHHYKFGPILRIYLSYSPCQICSKKLIDVQKRLKTKVHIRFGTFYKDYESGNIEGLEELLTNRVVLDIFHREMDWVQFLNDIQVPQTDQERYLHHVRKRKRIKREAIDQRKLDELYGKQLEQRMNSLSI